MTKKNKPTRSFHGITVIQPPPDPPFHLVKRESTPLPLLSDEKPPALRLPLAFLCHEHRIPKAWRERLGEAKNCWRCGLRSTLWADWESRPWHRRDPDDEFNLILIIW